MSSPVMEHRADPTAAGVNLIQSCARDFRGQCTQKFSQCTQPVKKVIDMMPSTAGGICLMLSASWIGHLVNRKSLWDNVFFGGGFNAASIVTLMHNFIDDEVQGIEWTDVRTMYFKQHNVTHHKTGVPLGNPNFCSGALAQNMIEAIRGSAGCYVTIDISGPAGAHAVAASARHRGRYVFFDPNYGEFSFAQISDLQSFLTILVRMSGYTNMFGQVRSDIWR